jgi:hypothetical protein
MPRGAIRSIAPALWPRPRRSHVGSIEFGIAEETMGRVVGRPAADAEVATAGTGHATPSMTKSEVFGSGTNLGGAGAAPGAVRPRLGPA